MRSDLAFMSDQNLSIIPYHHTPLPIPRPWSPSPLYLIPVIPPLLTAFPIYKHSHTHAHQHSYIHTNTCDIPFQTTPPFSHLHPSPLLPTPVRHPYRHHLFLVTPSTLTPASYPCQTPLQTPLSCHTFIPHPCSLPLSDTPTDNTSSLSLPHLHPSLPSPSSSSCWFRYELCPLSRA